MLAVILDLPSGIAYEMWSIKGIFSVFGILWLIFCLLPFSKGFWAGVLANGVYFIFACCVYWSLPDSWMSKRIYAYTEIEDPNVISLIYELDPQNSVSLGVYNLHDFESEYTYYYDYQVYAMNDRNSENYVCPSWVFHPGCLTLTPGLLHLPALGVVCLIKGAVKGD